MNFEIGLGILSQWSSSVCCRDFVISTVSVYPFGIEDVLVNAVRMRGAGSQPLFCTSDVIEPSRRHDGYWITSSLE